MASRMEKYHDDEQQRVSSRLERNKQKYDDFKGMAYSEFPSTSEMTIPTKFIDKDEPFNSDEYDDYQSRRERRNKEDSSTSIPEHKKLPYSFLDDDREDYDINSVLKRARENRNKEDELDYKRKLRTSEYNILEGLDQEKLEKIVKKKKEMYRDGEESDIKELINTITSNSLSNKVNEKLKEETELERQVEVEGESTNTNVNDNDSADLLSELLPDRIDETIITEAISEDMIEEYQPSIEEDEEKEELDTSFYTKSMDLSERDLVNKINEKNDELDTSFIENTSGQLFFKVLSVILVVVVIAVVLFIVYNACRVK